MTKNLIPMVPRNLLIFFSMIPTISRRAVNYLMNVVPRSTMNTNLGGNRTHDLRIRSTVTLPTELRGRTEKVGGDFRW